MTFVFAVCQLGAEPALKQEIAREHVGFRFAYSRPGLVTWKDPTGAAGPATRLRSVFARAYGASYGAVDVAEVAATLRPAKLHVFERDAYRPGEEPDDFVIGARAAAVRDTLGITLPSEPRAHDLVLDVIVSADSDDPLWIGAHVHDETHSPYPGGRIPLTVPADAPSRAWRKLEEALSWSGAPLRKGETAVEIGSAPGGASWALLARGLTVTGVDPGAMDPRVLAHPRYTHVTSTLGDVRREQLPPRVDWLLADVNLAPQVLLHGIRRLVAACKPTLHGVVFTLKLNDWRMAAEVPTLLARVANMGLADVRATQLPSNRQEICVVASARPTRRLPSRT